MDQEKQFIKNKDEIITTTLNRFVPMSVEEQKIFLFVLISSYLECMEKEKNATDNNIKAQWFCQKETYDFILRMFVSPPKELAEQGYDAKKFVLDQAKKDFEKIFKKECDA